MDNYFHRFLEIQNYVHYLLLTLGFFAAMKYEYLTASSPFWHYAVALLILDSLVHGLFYILPPPLQWKS